MVKRTAISRYHGLFDIPILYTYIYVMFSYAPLLYSYTYKKGFDRVLKMFGAIKPRP